MAHETVAMHHIHKIETHKHLRMDCNNWLAVCKECHNKLEENPMKGVQIKRMSSENYDNQINKALGGT